MYFKEVAFHKCQENIHKKFSNPRSFCLNHFLKLTDLKCYLRYIQTSNVTMKNCILVYNKHIVFLPDCHICPNFMLHVIEFPKALQNRAVRKFPQTYKRKKNFQKWIVFCWRKAPFFIYVGYIFIRYITFNKFKNVFLVLDHV